MRTSAVAVLSWFFLWGCAGQPERTRTKEGPAASPEPKSAQAEAWLREASNDHQHSRWDEALRKAEEAARMMEQQRNPRASEAYQVVGLVYLDTQRCDLASQAYERALQIREATLGAHHRLVAVSLASLAEARRCLGDESTTVALFERAYGIFARDPASLAERVDIALRLAALLNRQGQAQRAAALLRDALDGVRATRPSGDPLELSLLLRLHASLNALGDTRASAALFEELPSASYCVPEPCPTAAPPLAQTRADVAQAPNEVENAARVVGSLRGSFRACYSEALGRDRRAFGRLQVNIDVALDGVPWRVKARAAGPLDDEAVRCVLDVALKARFDGLSEPTQVIYVPITFVPTG